MEIIIASTIAAIPATLAALAAWRSVKPNHSGSLHQKLDRLETKFDNIENRFDSHMSYHFDDGR